MKISKVSTPSARLKEALELRNMKQIELAERTGISKPRISCYISGKYEPKQEALYQLGKALNVAEMWLAGYDIPYDRKWDDKQIDAISEIQNDANAYSDEQEDAMKSLMEEISEMVLVPEDMKRIRQYVEMMQAADLRKIADYFYKVYELQLTESEIQEVYEYATYIRSKRST